jgi:hypothetical protein
LPVATLPRIRSVFYCNAANYWMRMSGKEYEHNSTHLRDRLLLATVRLLPGWPKMPGERDCYARFTKEWINN